LTSSGFPHFSFRNRRNFQLLLDLLIYLYLSVCAPYAQRYHIASGNEDGAFRLVSGTGSGAALELAVSSPLDHEAKTDHRLVIAAIDGGEPSKTGLVTVHIIVADVNDNRPVFNQDGYTTSVREDLLIGMLMRCCLSTYINSTNSMLYDTSQLIIILIITLTLLLLLLSSIRLKAFLFFPFLPRHYRVTYVLLLPFITVWTPVVLAKVNII